MTPLYPQKLALKFADQGLLLSQYNLLVDEMPQSLFVCLFVLIIYATTRASF
jgi:hypothetical protein